MRDFDSSLSASALAGCLPRSTEALLTEKLHDCLPIRETSQLLALSAATTRASIIRRQCRICHPHHGYSPALEQLCDRPILTQLPVRNSQKPGLAIETTMDYSSSIHDADNPAGTSPWGSSPVPSPQHARTSSFPTSGDVPPSPTPYSSSTPGAGYSNDDIISGGGYQRPESSAGTESVAESDGHSPDTAESVRSQTEQQPFLAGQQQQKAPTQQQYQAQPHRAEPQRYHSNARQQQPTQAPQYKLQAKITGLERTGRKDPILRFDIHVRILLWDMYLMRKC